MVLNCDFLRPEQGWQCWDAEGPLGCVPWLHLAAARHEQADQTLPEGPGLWKLLAWKVGRGVEDIAEWEVIWGSDSPWVGEGRCVLAKGRASIQMGCGVGHPIPYCLVGSHWSGVRASRRIPDSVVSCSGNQLQIIWDACGI